MSSPNALASSSRLTLDAVTDPGRSTEDHAQGSSSDLASESVRKADAVTACPQEPIVAQHSQVGPEQVSMALPPADAAQTTGGLPDDLYPRKKARLDSNSRAEDIRLQVLRAENGAESEPLSAASSRQSSPSAASPTAFRSNEQPGFGGAKRRGANDRKPAVRNIDRVYLGDYDIRTWYHSPYPLEDDAGASTPAHSANNGDSTLQRGFSTKDRPHGRKSKGAKDNGLQHRQSDSDALSTSPAAAASSAADTLAPSVHSASTSGSRQASPMAIQPKIPHLWICEGCFKYMRTYAGWNAHKRECQHRHPPGRKVYQRGAHIVWEVDGAQEKLYAQNLSLFGKLFIDHKTIFFDVEPFLFYVVTDASANFDYVLGYFSKEKVSYDDYNLACIITFPPFQQKGFGTLMIELSYYLSAKAAIVGTPERPLSELGFKGYVSYWSAAVLRTLAIAFNEDDAAVSSRLLLEGQATAAGSSPSKTANISLDAAASSSSADQSNASESQSVPVSKAQKRAARRVRAVLLGLEVPRGVSTEMGAARVAGLADRLEDAEELSAEELADLRKVRRSVLGFGGELPPALAAKLNALGTSPTKNHVDKDDHPSKKPDVMNNDVEDDTNQEEPQRTVQGDPVSAQIVPASSATTNAGPVRAVLHRAARDSTPGDATHQTSKPLTRPQIGGSTSSPRVVLGGSNSSAALPGALELEAVDGRPRPLATTLQRISAAANLRPEDCAFALSECGLLETRLSTFPEDVKHAPSVTSVRPRDLRASAGHGQEAANGIEGGAANGGIDGTQPDSGPYILISRDAVKQAILRKGIKRPVLDAQYVFV